MSTSFTRLASRCRLIAITLTILIATIQVSARRDDDVVVLKNGDRLTGEIKKLLRGELSFKASYMAEAVRLDWTKVERLESKSKFIIFLTSGKLVTGELRVVSAEDLGNQNFMIGVAKESIVVKQPDVIRIFPAEESFLSQLEGSVDFGLSFTSGNDQYQAEFLATTTYRNGDHKITASVDSSFSGQPEGTSSARRQFTFDYRKQLTPKHYVGGIADFLSSDQQSLDLRTTVGGLVGRNMLLKENTRWSVFGGMVLAKEKYSVTAPQTQPAEAATITESTEAAAIAGLEYVRFRFTKTDITARVITYPSFTTPGRVRMQAISDMRIKIAKDLYWGLHIYENFDNKPPINAKKNDLGISTSLGWKF